MHSRTRFNAANIFLVIIFTLFFCIMISTVSYSRNHKAQYHGSAYLWSEGTLSCTEDVDISLTAKETKTLLSDIELEAEISIQSNDLSTDFFFCSPLLDTISGKWKRAFLSRYSNIHGSYQKIDKYIVTEIYFDSDFSALMIPLHDIDKIYILIVSKDEKDFRDVFSFAENYFSAGFF